MSHPELIKHLGKEYQSVSEVITNFEWLESYFFDHDDLRGVFTTAYLHITRSINNAFGSNTFLGDEWTRSYLTRFANLYREAVLNYENQKTELVPKSWLASFELAKNKEGLIIQHLLLGINAHINHDLAIALFDIKIDPERDHKYADHTNVNLILEKATDGLKHEVAEKYAPILNRLDQGLGTLDDEITEFSIPKAREHAWSFAIALTAAQSDIEREILRKSLNEQAAVLSNLIMASPTRDPRFIGIINFLKWIDRKINRIIRFFKASDNRSSTIS